MLFRNGEWQTARWILPGLPAERADVEYQWLLLIGARYGVSWYTVAPAVPAGELGG